MPTSVDCNVVVLFHHLMHASLRVKDPVISPIVTELFGLFGEGPVPELLFAAGDSTNSPAHRLRALEMVERIGTISEPSAIMRLSLLANDPNEKVRAVAHRLVMSLDLGDPMANYTGSPPA